MSLLTSSRFRPMLSICIPTFNRSRHLENCLHSICVARGGQDIEVCVSDNASTDNTGDVVRSAAARMPLKYRCNPENLGMARNFLQVVAMASGEFVWLVGDDDLIMPDGIERVLRLIRSKPSIDFFYVNASHLNARHLERFAHPFDLANLPPVMERFSKADQARAVDFFQLISPQISFDFLGGIFLSVFRRELWDRSTNALDVYALASKATFSHFDNTFPHLKVWAHAFRSSRAFFNPEPVIVCITGVREWAPLMPLIMSVRLPEALRVYRRNGMSWWRYVYCKNYALRNFGADMANMLLHRRVYKFPVPYFQAIASSLAYPNTYLSILYFVVRRLRGILAFKAR
jgi:glycosyltransferase involved in cell wall biosynthesis